MGEQGTVYLLHLDPPYKHAAHYCGWTSLETEERLERHLAGHGSPLIRAAVAAGSVVSIVAMLPGDRALERRIKNRGGHGSHAICPVCRPGYLAKRRARRAATSTTTN